MKNTILEELQNGIKLESINGQGFTLEEIKAGQVVLEKILEEKDALEEIQEDIVALEEKISLTDGTEIHDVIVALEEKIDTQIVELDDEIDFKRNELEDKIEKQFMNANMTITVVKDCFNLVCCYTDVLLERTIEHGKIHYSLSSNEGLVLLEKDDVFSIKEVKYMVEESEYILSLKNGITLQYCKA